MPFPEIQTESTISRHSQDQDSTDFSRAMSDMSLNNGNDSVYATTSDSSLYSDLISGLPRDRRSDHHLRAWDGQEPQERLHDINRESTLSRPSFHAQHAHTSQPHASRLPRAPRCPCIDVSRLTPPSRAACTPSTDGWRKCLYHSTFNRSHHGGQTHQTGRHVVASFVPRPLVSSITSQAAQAAVTVTQLLTSFPGRFPRSITRASRTIPPLDLQPPRTARRTGTRL